jgi:hypothetical protein
MPWYSKEQPTPFDATQIEGMQSLHGDVLAQRYRQDWTAGKKYPLITFPSGLEREITTGSEDQSNPHIHLFDRVALPYQSSRDEALAQVAPLAQEHGYQLAREQDAGLRITDPVTRRGYAITFDNEARQIVNVEPFPEYAMELMPGKIRAALPPLYSQENKGLEAVAPVKFFVPAGSWTWYATEFDGDDLLFGLVSGFEVELGYFSLRELDGVRDQLGLPIERDLYYSPTTLKEIQAYERNLKY